MGVWVHNTINDFVMAACVLLIVQWSMFCWPDVVHAPSAPKMRAAAAGLGSVLEPLGMSMDDTRTFDGVWDQYQRRVAMDWCVTATGL